MPRGGGWGGGHSFSIYACFSGKKETSMHISRTLQSFSRKTLRKIGPKRARKY